MKKFILTKQGFGELQHELEELKTGRRGKAVERLKKAREMGDLSENSEYHAAKEDLSYIDGRLEEIEIILRDADVHDETNHQKVDIGTTVEVSINGVKDTYLIVGEMEADISQNRLSHESPIGKALMGAKKGEAIKVTTPRGEVEYLIIEIK